MAQYLELKNVRLKNGAGIGDCGVDLAIRKNTHTYPISIRPADESAFCVDVEGVSISSLDVLETSSSCRRFRAVDVMFRLEMMIASLYLIRNLALHQ